MLRSHTSLRRTFLIVTAVLLCIIVPFSLLSSAPFKHLNGWLTSSATPELAIPASAPEVQGTYDWATRSSFDPVRQLDAANKSIEELCASFPTHLLDEIQPVLKTGHGVVDSRVKLQLQSVSACLSNLLIFSDKDEQFGGHDIIDVIADLRKNFTDSHPDLGAWRNGSIARGDATRKQGWVTDKFKFLPAISRAWRMRPNRRWYVFYEADTYIVWDNVFRLLENFDPDELQYFGSPSPGAPGEWFANGGPGYIISRGAMRRLVEDDWNHETGAYLGSKLMESNFDFVASDCCGDSTLGAVLLKHGIVLKGLFPMFTVHNPNGIPFADKHWCQPILTMHKPQEEDALGLWRWEWEHRELRRPLVYRDLATSYIDFGNLDAREDWNNMKNDRFPAEVPGDSSTEDPHESFDACGRACKAHHDCWQWNYHIRKCHFVRALRWGLHEEPGLAKFESNEGAEYALEEWNIEDLRFRAGWDTEKITRWMDERPCGLDDVRWVTPSNKRIF
ncbi:hypothetical protein LTR37_010862 [Vermiconidia calcicola]|uniref:Uncharacterized protein n=1 Tax=Vermiconidia calcicola TaxID=1690605 RepID=A0ACC3N490_9PEZI|nr:hypothetical protein LTR37_010862 [Vermiconidia calcicola]